VVLIRRRKPPCPVKESRLEKLRSEDFRERGKSRGERKRLEEYLEL